MTIPKDHVSDAEQYAISAWNSAGEERVDRRWIEQANISALLAIVAAQDRANELKRIEILAQIVYANPDPDIGFDSRQEQAAIELFHSEGAGLAPSIARSLGLGGESDGE